MVEGVGSGLVWGREEVMGQEEYGGVVGEWEKEVEGGEEEDSK